MKNATKETTYWAVYSGAQ